MEAFGSLSPRSQPQHNTSSRFHQKTPESRVSDSEILDEELLCELKTFQQTLQVKEGLLEARKNEIASQKAKTKGELKTLFAQLHELLERKQVELSDQVDYGYEDFEFEVEERKDKMYDIRDPVDTVLDMVKFRFGKVTNDMLRTLCAETRENMQSVVEGDADIPDFIINSDTKSKVETMRLGTFSNAEEIRSVERNFENNPAQEGTAAAAAAAAVYETNSHVPLSDLEVPDDVFHDADCGQTEQIRSLVSCEQSITSTQGLVSAGSGISVGSEPSASPLVLVQDDDPEEDPPPYWQAVGLEGPTQESQPTEVPPLHTNSYTDPSPEYTEFDPNPTQTNNVLEPWHSFPLRRQYDVRKPLYVALSWDDRRICVADRKNGLVKFFSHRGNLLKEMRIKSGEIYDIAYLESFCGEARYIATLPKENALLLLSVFEDNSSKLVKKIIFRKYYTCICRGTLCNTLIGAVNVLENYSTAEKPRVEMFDFDGNVIQIYQLTLGNIEFQYPRTVKVYNNFIFVSDWRLNLVAVFHTNGSPVGLYKGTPTCPLVNPLDMDIDCYGNVLIVDGEFPNIHVISSDGRPIEVIKVPKSGADRSQPKLIAFDAPSRRLAMVRSNGEMAVFKFRDSYKNIRPGELVLHPQAEVSVPPDESLPYVEGMLPTTIASIGRQRNRRH